MIMAVQSVVSIALLGVRQHFGRLDLLNIHFMFIHVELGVCCVYEF